MFEIDSKPRVGLSLLVGFPNLSDHCFVPPVHLLFVFLIRKLVDGMAEIVFTKPKASSGFLGGTSCKEPACQCRKHKRHRFDPWVGKILWRRKWHPTPVFLLRESQGQWSLVGYSPRGRRVRDD